MRNMASPPAGQQKNPRPAAGLQLGPCGMPAGPQHPPLPLKHAAWPTSMGWYTYRTFSVSTYVCCFPLPTSLGKAASRPSMRMRLMSMYWRDTRAAAAQQDRSRQHPDQHLIRQPLAAAPGPPARTLSALADDGSRQHHHIASLSLLLLCGVLFWPLAGCRLRESCSRLYQASKGQSKWPSSAFCLWGWGSRCWDVSLDQVCRSVEGVD